MREIFELDIDASPDLRHLGNGNFPREDNSLGAKIFPNRCRAEIRARRLRGNMQRQRRRGFFGDGKHAQVGDQRRIDADILQETKIIGKPCQVVVSRNDIHGDVHFLPVSMRKGNALFHFRGRKISAVRAKAESFPGQIHGVGTIANGHPQFFRIAGGG